MNPTDKGRVTNFDRNREDSEDGQEERHLQQQRQASHQRIAFLHQRDLLFLQLLCSRIALVELLHPLLKVLHLRLHRCRLSHRYRAAPAQREEEHIQDDRQDHDRPAVVVRVAD